MAWAVEIILLLSGWLWLSNISTTLQKCSLNWVGLREDLLVARKDVIEKYCQKNEQTKNTNQISSQWMGSQCEIEILWRTEDLWTSPCQHSERNYPERLYKTRLIFVYSLFGVSNSHLLEITDKI